MKGSSDIVRYLELLVERQLSNWPSEWAGFHWPGYTYEHTLRVRSLSVSMARQLGTDVEVVEFAALLHDIGKPDREPHGDAGAECAEVVLSELGVDTDTRRRVSDIIRTHVAPDPAYPIENLVLSDADYIDANFGYVAFTRYITIRASRDQTVDEMVAGATEWFSGVAGRRAKLVTELGRTIARERFERMERFLGKLVEDLEHQAEGKGSAIGIAHYLAADAYRPSLLRQVGQMKGVLHGSHAADELRRTPFLGEFVRMLKEEMVGER